MNNRPLALALASGGARGAYQAGALLCLAEHGFRFRAVAGTSIGALNGAFYAQGDGSAGHLEGLCALWRGLPEAGILQLDLRSASAAAVSFLVKELRCCLPLLSKLGLSVLDPQPMANFLDRWLDYARVCSSPVRFWVTALPSVNPLWDIVSAPWREAHYFLAQEWSPPELRKALLASVAIPLAFPAQEIEGRRYNDAALTDPLPAQVLFRDGARAIFSIFLSGITVQDRADFPSCTIFQIRPTTNIDSGLSSVFDFSRSAIERLLDLGYGDAMASLSEVTDRWERMAVLQELSRRNVRLADALPERPGLDFGP